MPGEVVGREVVKGDRPAAAPVADQVAALWRVALRPLGGYRDVAALAGGALPRGVDVIGVVGRIGKAAARPGHPHDVVDKRRGPRELGTLARRKDSALGVVLAGPTLLRRPQRQPLPPIIADPLPQPLGAFVVGG